MSRQRLHQVPRHGEEPEARSAANRVRETADRIPTPVRAGAGVVAALWIADALGLNTPLAAFLDRMLANPVVYAWIVVFFLIIVGVLMAVAVWVGCSVVSHIMNKRWIRRIVGFEPQAIHQGAASVDEGVDEYRQIIAELEDQNAELIFALDHTDSRYREVLRENAQLRELSRSDEHRQLELEEGG